MTGTVKDLTVAGAFRGKDYCGVIAGYNKGAIENCLNLVSLEGGNYIGGIAGVNYDGGQITGCRNSGRVSGATGVGGIAGWNKAGGTISEWRVQRDRNRRRKLLREVSVQETMSPLQTATTRDLSCQWHPRCAVTPAALWAITTAILRICTTREP